MSLCKLGFIVLYYVLIGFVCECEWENRRSFKRRSAKVRSQRASWFSSGSFIQLLFDSRGFARFCHLENQEFHCILLSPA